MFIDFEKAFDSRVQPKHFRSRGPSENVRVCGKMSYRD